jgi:hypothetical protein
VLITTHSPWDTLLNLGSHSIAVISPSVNHLGGFSGKIMKLKYLFITALASLAIATGAQAQLGWTLEQCNAKYGDGKYHLGNYHYKVQALELIVQQPKIINGTVSSIWYYKGSTDHKLSAETITKLLKQNALGLTWFDFGDEGWGAFVSEESKAGNEIDAGKIVAWLDDSGYLEITVNHSFKRE